MKEDNGYQVSFNRTRTTAIVVLDKPPGKVNPNTRTKKIDQIAKE